MKIALNYEINIEVQEDNKKIDTFKIWFRELTKKEKKEYDQLVKDFTKLNKTLTKISRKAPVLEQKATAYNNLKKYDKELLVLEKMEQLDEELTKAEEQIENLAGDDFVDTQAKKSFDLRVSGKDKQKLVDLAESQGYANILKMLEKAKEGLLKKDSTK